MAKDEHKIGFLASGGPGNPNGIGYPDGYVPQLHNAGRSAKVSCNDGTVGISDALRTGGDQHTMAYAVVKDRSEYWRVPNYSLEPEPAAIEFKNRVEPEIAPEIKAVRDKVWIFILNEPDKTKMDWLGYFGYYSGLLWNADNYKPSLYGMAAGTPGLPGQEITVWKTPGMRKFLELCASRPDRVSINLHEYSYDVNNILNAYPYLIGRFQYLYLACDQMGIPRPPTMFGEWGWEQGDAGNANDVLRVAHLYSQFDNILGAFMWYLGAYQGTNIHNQTQQLIAPVTQDAKVYVAQDFERPLIAPPDQPGNGNGNGGDYKAVVEKAPQKKDATKAEYLKIAEDAYDDYGRDLTMSIDQMKRLVTGGDPIVSYVKVVDPARPSQIEAIAELEKDGLNYIEVFVNDSPGEFSYTFWPTTKKRVTSPFGAPRNDWPFPGHEGIDLASPFGSPYYAPAAGTIVKVSDKRSNGEPSLYGWHVIVDHGNGATSLLAHAMPNPPVSVGELVASGQVVAYSGNTGNSDGAHLHLTLKIVGEQLPGWPPGYVDPWPYLEDLFNDLDPPSEPTEQGYLWRYIEARDNNLAITTGNVNFREEPGSASHKIGLVLIDTVVELLSPDPVNGYYKAKVSISDIVGYDPTPQDTIDLLDYIRGDEGVQYELQYTWRGGGTHPVDNHRDGNLFKIVKGDNGQFEGLYFDEQYIYRDIDTSEGDNLFYIQMTGPVPGAIWCKRHMRIGETVVKYPHVEHYYSDSCILRTQGDPTDFLTLVDRGRWISESGIEFEDVIYMEWRAGEGYYFARGVGLVGFVFTGGRSWISEWHDNRPLSAKQPCYQITERYYANS